MQLHDTSDSFEYFSGCWSFTDLSQGDVSGSKVQIVNSQVEGFVKRAGQLYTRS